MLIKPNLIIYSKNFHKGLLDYIYAQIARAKFHLMAQTYVVFLNCQLSTKEETLSPSKPIPYLPLIQCRVYHWAQVCLSPGPRLPKGGGGIFLPMFFFTMDSSLCGAILNLKVFCFGAILDTVLELIVYGSVPYSGRK